MSRSLLALVLWTMSAALVRADGHLIAVASNQGMPDESELRYAEQDALSLRDVLKQLGTHQNLHTQLLLGDQAAKLIEAIQRLPITSDDTLYVYFSGHANADGLHLGSKLVSFDALKVAIESVPARMKLLIVDACSSGQATRTKGVKPAAPFSVVLDDRVGVTGTAIVTSSAESEDSQESDELGASFFTFHLLQGLRGAADRDRDRRVTLNEVFAYASRQTLRSTAFTHQLQHPTFRGKLSGHDTELVLARLDAAPASALLTLEGAGQYLIFDSHDELFAEITVDSAGARYMMPPGRWLFQRRTESGAEEQWIELKAGEERQLSTHNASPVPLTRLAAKGRADNGMNHRVQLLCGAQGPAVDGHSTLPAVLLGYRAALSRLEIGAELISARDLTTDEVYSARFRLYYGVDIGMLRVGAGAAVGANLQRQTGSYPAAQFYPVAGVTAFLDARLYQSLAMHIELGPTLQLVKLERGSARESSTTLALSWWAGAGPSWGF